MPLYYIYRTPDSLLKATETTDPNNGQLLGIAEGTDPVHALFTYQRKEAAQLVKRAVLDRAGFITAEELQTLLRDPATRFDLFLVRTGQGRFLATAQDVPHFVALIEEHSRRTAATDPRRDHIRDVSATQPTLAQWRAQLTPRPPEGSPTPADGLSHDD